MTGKRHFRGLPDEMEADIVSWADRGLNGNAIHAALVEKYKERAPKSRQTVYNFLKRRCPVATENDPKAAVWTLLTALERGDPVEKIRYLLSGPGRMESKAEWAWVIHQVAPHLDHDAVDAYAKQYRDIAASPDDRATRAMAAFRLDRKLREEPWPGD